MAQMQWLGTIPTERSTGSQVADVISGGMQGYQYGKGRAEEKARYKTEEERKEKQFGLQERQIAGQEMSRSLQQKQVENKILSGLMDKILLVPIDKRQAAIDASRGIMTQMGMEGVARSLEDPKILDLLSGEQKSDISGTDIALKYAVSGTPMPGHTIEETKKKAGTFIPESKPFKITGADIEQAEKDEPWYSFIPGRWTKEEKETDELRKKMKAQWSSSKRQPSSGVGSDPLGARR